MRDLGVSNVVSVDVEQAMELTQSWLTILIFNIQFTLFSKEELIKEIQSLSVD